MLFTDKELKFVRVVRVIFWGLIVVWIVGLMYIYLFDFIPARDVWIMSM